MSPRAIWVGSALFLLAGGWLPARAEKYLGATEAARIAFPAAEVFRERWVELTPSETKAIAQKAGVKVRVAKVRLILAERGTNLVGIVLVDQVIGKHELIDYAVALVPEGTIAAVEILEYRENYGQAIKQAKWRAQFRDKSVASPLKLNDDIYNISGATLSCRHVAEGIKRLLATFDMVVRPRVLSSAGRVPGQPGEREP